MSWWQDQRAAWARDWQRSGRSLRQTPSRAARIVGFVARIAVYAGLFAALLALVYAGWPSRNIFDVPLASLTLGEIFYTGAFIFIGGSCAWLLVAFLFSPSSDPKIQKAWVSFGILLLVAIAIAYFNLR